MIRLLFISISKGKLRNMAGRGKDKKEDKEKKEDRIRAARGEDVDSDAADLVALLANQVVKDEKKKLRPGIRHKKKGKNDKKKISKCFNAHVHCMYTTCILHVHCMCAACTLHVHCMYTACIPVLVKHFDSCP